MRNKRLPSLYTLDLTPLLLDTPHPVYTTHVKTTVSIPDDLFEKVERLARRRHRSRSAVYSAALREYVARHSADEVTEAMNKVCAEVEQGDEFVREASRRLLMKVEW